MAASSEAMDGMGEGVFSGPNGTRLVVHQRRDRPFSTERKGYVLGRAPEPSEAPKRRANGAFRAGPHAPLVGRPRRPSKERTGRTSGPAWASRAPSRSASRSGSGSGRGCGEQNLRARGRCAGRGSRPAGCKEASSGGAGPPPPRRRSTPERSPYRRCGSRPQGPRRYALEGPGDHLGGARGPAVDQGGNGSLESARVPWRRGAQDLDQLAPIERGKTGAPGRKTPSAWHGLARPSTTPPLPRRSRSIPSGSGPCSSSLDHVRRGRRRARRGHRGCGPPPRCRRRRPRVRRRGRRLRRSRPPRLERHDDGFGPLIALAEDHHVLEERVGVGTGARDLIDVLDAEARGLEDRRRRAPDRRARGAA